MGMGLVVHMGFLFKHALKKGLEAGAGSGNPGTPGDAFGVSINDKTRAPKPIAENAVRSLFTDALHTE